MSCWTTRVGKTSLAKSIQGRQVAICEMALGGVRDEAEIRDIEGHMLVQCRKILLGMKKQRKIIHYFF